MPGFPGSKRKACDERWARECALLTHRFLVFTSRTLCEDEAVPDARTMKILVTGSSGLIGSALVPLFTGAGDKVVQLTRKGEGTLRWDPSRGEIDKKAFEGVDAVVHLAGENIASGRWTQARKGKIAESRIEGTRLLVRAIAERPTPVLVCASAIGFYGDRGEETLDEKSPPGTGFLPELCQEWERVASSYKGRVVSLRIGVVLSPAGGALQKMLLPFKLGAGGRVGSGRQWWSWVAIDDAIAAIRHVLLTPSLTGPVNVVSPSPVTNAEFTRVLGHVLHRPTIVPLPAFAARLALGEMGDALLLASTRVQPRKLLESGYTFRFPDLEASLKGVLGKPF